MADNSSQGSVVSLNEAESVDRKKILKRQTSRGLPRHPIQRHCPVRQGGAKRKKRRYPSISELPHLEEIRPSTPVLLQSQSFSETSSSSSSTSPPKLSVVRPSGTRKRAIDKCDGRGETALHKAAIKGDVQLVKSLLRRGANPNRQDFAGWTPLHEACIRGWYNVALALLKAGANANTPGLHNVTALHDASAWSHVALVKLLLRYGANLTSQTDKGDTPIGLASAAVLHYLENHGLIPERRTNVVPERTDEMRKSTYRSKVVKANSADVTFKIKVRCEQKGEDKAVGKQNKKSKKKKSRLCHSKKKMEVEETKKEVTTSATAAETKEGDEPKTSTPEEAEASSRTAANVDSADAESRRSSVSLDDDDEGKRNKRRKDKEEHSRSGKEDVRAAKEDHGHGKKDEHPPKKEDHAHKKDEYQHKKEEHAGTPRAKPSSASSSSPKSTTSVDGLDGEDGGRSVGSPGPKVPPLKIVIPPVESEQGSRNGKNTTRHHPYVVVSNDETSTAVSTVTTSPSSPAVQTTASKEEAHSPSSASATLTSEEQRGQQRVLRSSNSNRDRGVASNSSTNGCSSGTNSSATSGSSSPVAPDLSPQQEPAPPKEETKVKTEPGVRSKTETTAKGKMETTVKVKSEPEEEAKPSVSETRSTTVDTSSVELHPRKRKLKSKPEPSHSTESDHMTSFGSAPHPHEVPVTNCYQMFMDIRRQIDVKRKGLFPIQPKPPQGFKDYLMNRCTYTLSGNSARLKRRNAEPPEGIPEGMKELYQEQEAERYSLRMQHVVEKEKLVLSVEQEILRVHGRAARALANQALPFSACTILKDEEVYNVITPEQEEKDRNARSRYNGRLFISWLQDVDDKWEKIKEEMLARHHKEAESLNAIQKFKWDLKMRQLGLWKKRYFIPVENFVPMLSVSDDFDLLPE